MLTIILTTHVNFLVTHLAFIIFSVITWLTSNVFKKCSSLISLKMWHSEVHLQHLIRDYSYISLSLLAINELHSVQVLKDHTTHLFQMPRLRMHGALLHPCVHLHGVVLNQNGSFFYFVMYKTYIVNSYVSFLNLTVTIKGFDFLISLIIFHACFATYVFRDK
jgi:hypothetical protein